MAMIWITAKTWRNSYLITGNQRTLKNSKSYLNVLRVFQREGEKLAKVRRKIIAKERSSPNAYKKSRLGTSGKGLLLYMQKLRRLTFNSYSDE